MNDKPTQVEIAEKVRNAEHDLKYVNTSPSQMMVGVSDTREYTGGSVSYYQIKIDWPTTAGRDAYTAECNDLIEALGMNYAEGNVLKALWRICAARKGLSKRGYSDGVYDAEKIVFFGNRVLKQQRD